MISDSYAPHLEDHLAPSRHQQIAAQFTIKSVFQVAFHDIKQVLVRVG